MLPTRTHSDDSGLDLHAAEEAIIEPGKAAPIRTGIAIALPPGTEGQIRPRSGLALEHAVTVLNSPGTVDHGYRGEIQVILINHGPRPFHVTKGMRIAQLVVEARLVVDVTETDNLPDTDRGQSGFGSTGQ